MDGYRLKEWSYTMYIYAHAIFSDQSEQEYMSRLKLLALQPERYIERVVLHTIQSHVCGSIDIIGPSIVCVYTYGTD